MDKMWTGSWLGPKTADTFTIARALMPSIVEDPMTLAPMRVACLSAALLFTVACGDDDKDTTDPTPTQTIADLVVGNPDFDTLEAAVVAADLADTLAGPGPFTVFAPTDEAFAKLPAGALDALLADKDELTKVLTYHVVSGKVDAATVVTLDKATTLEGDDITIEVVAGGVVLNGSVKVTATDIAADNGIIHVIDAVLMPPVPVEPDPKSITAIVVGSDDFDTLETAVVAADLADTLAGPGPFTVFAPTDAAFAKLPAGVLDALVADKDELTKVLTHHVVSGKVDAATVVTLDKATTLEGDDITIEVVDGDVVLNGSVKVTATDIEAANGIIHVIDAVLMPPADEPEPQTITDIVVANEDFDTLEAAVVAADLAGTLAGEGPFTVFAPTDAAFALIPAATLQGLLADKEALSDVLLYHVVGDRKLAADVVASTHLVMANGAIAPISTVGGAHIGAAAITMTDIAASNGVIHVIDAVLLPPPTIAEIAAGNPDFETLVAAASAAGLVDDLAGDTLLTVFAPNDDAFAEVPAATLDALLADVPALVDVLLYHAVAGVVPASVATTLTTATMLNGDSVSLSFDAGTETLTVNGATVIGADIWARNGVIHVIDAVLLPPQ
jgi:transforming growth factor-beta-induced protein